MYFMEWDVSSVFPFLNVHKVLLFELSIREITLAFGCMEFWKLFELE